MKIEKRKSPAKNLSLYPYKVIKNNITIYIPQQKKFGTYCSNHGCSVTAVSIALQYLGRKQKSDGSILNPKEVASYAMKNIGGYNGSKLSIYGCAKTINKMMNKEVAYWYPNTGKNSSKIREHITNALRKNYIVLFEEKNPIHTVALLGFDSNGKVIVATNGSIKRRSLKTQISYGLSGTSSKGNQKSWWNGRNHGAGYVIIKK